MKVLFITATLDTHTGWGRYSSALINEMKKQGVAPVVVTLGDLPKPKTILQFVGNCLRARDFASTCDIVHALDTWPHAVYSFIAVLGTSKHLFVTAVGTYSVAPLASFLKRQLIRLVYQRASKVFAISNYVSNLISNKIKTDKLETVYLGLSPLPLPSDKYHFDNYPIILTVGAVEYRKGQLEIVEAMPRILQKFSKALYVIASVSSDKAYRDKITKRVKELDISNHVRFVDDADMDEDLSALYNLCDIFVLVSRQFDGHVEGFGIVALEAASFGKPIIASRKSGVSEAMREGYNGELVQTGDSVSIVEAVAKVLIKHEQYSRNSLDWVRQFTWLRTASRYLDFYSRK